MKKHILTLIEELIKQNNGNLVNDPLTPLWANYHTIIIDELTMLKNHIKNMNEVWVYVNLITCDFKEKTMTFELPEWFHLKSGEYYIEFNK